MVKGFTVLVSTISNSQVFFAEKNEKLLQKLLTLFSANLLAYICIQ